MNYVYVLDPDGKPMMPTTRFGKVRRMLRSGKAKAVTTRPFTIRLTYWPKMHETQPVVAGFDPGRTNIGLCAVRNDGRTLYLAHCETRNKEIKNLMSARKDHRQASRRGERLARKRIARRLGTTVKGLLRRIIPGCNEPLCLKDITNTEARFNNRLRPKGWLTPTARHLLLTHVNLLKQMQKILPVSDVVVEINRFAFMQLDNPGVKKKDIDFQHGQLSGFSGVREAVKTQQNGLCLCCKKHGIEHFHHIIPRSKRGSDTLPNIAGLCKTCHEKVHTSEEAAKKLASKKAGLTKKYGGTSVLNQIIPKLFDALKEIFPGHTYATTGQTTKAFREEHGLLKDHTVDAYSVACSILESPVVSIPDTYYEIHQFRRHDRAIIHHQTERTYYLNDKAVCKNRHKRFEQKGDSLEEFAKVHPDLVSKLKVKKSRRYYNDPDRILPGATFIYEGKQYVLTGQLSGGQYYRAFGHGTMNFSAKRSTIVWQNTGLVYVG